MSRHLVMIVAATITAAGTVANSPTIVYVDANSDQTPHDGSDWRHAYVHLYEALASPPPGATIRVADGVYEPDTSGPGDPRAAAFSLVDGVAIEGGYAGCGASNPNTRDFALYETILSGDIGAPGVGTDNCYHVVLGAGVDPSAVLDGVTITDGSADGPGAQSQGGGLFLAGGSPTFRDCTFRQNSAQYGGGVFNAGGHPTFLRTSFDENTATESGGALYNYSSLGQPGPFLTDCEFSDNVAQSSGGAVRNYDSDAEFTRCMFRENHTRYGGAGVANGGLSSPVIARCIFDFNRTDTLFALYDCYGGGMHNTDNSHPLIVSCVFVGNAAYSTLPALSYGGALASSGDAEPTIINCTLFNNYANIGHGQHCDGQSSTAVVSSILWNGGEEIITTRSAAVTVTYSTVAGSWPGTGNIADDPLLDDLRLQAGSPCINAGDPANDPDGEADLDGHARMLCGRVDMGAYEFGIGDYDCDQTVGTSDFANWGDCMTGPSLGPYGAGCQSFDYEFDGDVDLNDFVRFQRQFSTP